MLKVEADFTPGVFYSTHFPFLRSKGFSLFPPLSTDFKEILLLTNAGYALGDPTLAA